MAGRVQFGVIAGAVLGFSVLAFGAPDGAMAQTQGGRPASELVENGQIPRLANGKPNFEGNWQKVRAPRAGGGGGGGAPGGGAPRAGGAGPGGPPGAGGPAPAGLTGGGAPAFSDAPVSKNFNINGSPIPYTPEAVRERLWLNTQEALDGEVRCQMAGTPRAHIAPPYPHMIIQDDNQVVILYEYVHEPHIIPISNAPLKGTHTWTGESRAHWEGDTLVVVTKNFNGRAYISYNEQLSDQAVVEERYTMTGPNTYDWNLKITDPFNYSKPFTMTIKHGRQADADLLLSYDCLEGEDDLKHYAAESGGLGGVKLVKQPATIYGCLRAEKVGNDFSYTVTPYGGAPVKLTPTSDLKSKLPPLMDREVKFDGKWAAPNKDFSAVYANVHAEGCRWDGK